MQTTEYADSNPYFANDYQLDRPKITRGKFRAFAFQRAVADGVITYVWDRVLLSTCGTRFIEFYILLGLNGI